MNTSEHDLFLDVVVQSPALQKCIVTMSNGMKIRGDHIIDCAALARDEESAPLVTPSRPDTKR